MCTSSAAVEFSSPESKRPRNHWSEYWYIESTSARSLAQKKRSDPRNAVGRYFSRVTSISFSVFSASVTLRECVCVRETGRESERERERKRESERETDK